jgi:hypothetical protein
MKTYNVVFNSSKSVSKVNGNNEVVYGVNWGFMDVNKTYKISFNFYTQDIVNLEGDDITQVALFIDGSPATFLAGDSVNYQTSFCLGIVKPQKILPGGAGVELNILTCDYLDNPPVFLRGRPMNNFVRVQLQSISGNATNYAFGLNKEYIMILHLEEVE